MSLIERLEAAEVGSRELDAGVCDALFPHQALYGYAPAGGHPGRWPFAPGSTYDAEVHHYTTSLDAALALAEQVLPGCEVRMIKDTSGPGWASVGIVEAVSGNASDLPLALCIAILKAKETK